MVPGRSTSSKLPPPDNIRGALWMLGSCILFSLVWLATKKLGPEIPATQVAFIRSCVGLLAVSPFFAKHGLRIFRTQRPVLHVVRVVFATLNSIAMYYGVAHLPLAVATSLTFTRPLFMIVVAIVALGERVHWRRAIATIIGFAGVLMILGPTDLILNHAALVALGGAASAAIALAVIRQQSIVDGSLTMMAWYMVGTTTLSAPFALLHWHAPSAVEWAYLIFIGMGATLGQFMLIRAFMFAEATVVNPVEYSQIIIGALFGYFLFSEIPNIWIGIGAVVVIAATLYILFREAKVKGEAGPEPAIEKLPSP
jgi:drug/metabolite transporter (DMT)-like permease